MKLIRKHGEIVADLDKADECLNRLKTMMPPLIEESKRLAESYQTGLILARHLVGGRIYLKWRYRFSIKPNRDYLDLSSESGQAYICQLPASIRDQLFEIDKQAQAINHRFSSVFAERTSLRRFDKHLKGLKQCDCAADRHSEFV